MRRGALLVVALLALAPVRAEERGVVAGEGLSVAPTTLPAEGARPFAAREDDEAGDEAQSSSAFSFSRTILALGAVVGLILILRALLVRYGGARLLAAAGGGPAGPVRVLSRTPLGVRRGEILLLQVGRRVLIVADAGGGQLSPLGEVREPDEVAQLLAASTARPADGGAFGGLFRKAQDDYDREAEDGAILPPSARRGGGDPRLAGYDVPAAPALDEPAIVGDPAASALQAQLRSLIGRVRTTARTVGRSDEA